MTCNLDMMLVMNNDEICIVWRFEMLWFWSDFCYDILLYCYDWFSSFRNLENSFDLMQCCNVKYAYSDVLFIICYMYIYKDKKSV